MHPKPDKTEGWREPISAAAPDSFLTRLRGAWHSRWPKWYARMIPGKQHVIDKLVSLRLEEFQAQMVELDREDSELSHQIAELSAQISQMNQHLESLERRLETLEVITGQTGSSTKNEQ